MTLRTRTDALLLAGFCAFLFFYGLGQFGLIGADEPRYAQVAREMLDRHDWITPVLGGQPWLEKPPLYYWQAMLVYSVMGVSDAAARIPSAIDATLLVISVYLFFRRFRRGLEVDAALITASCAGVIGYARAASMDMALGATFAIGTLAWWAWRESGKKVYLALFYAFMALGMLAKGPVAPLLAGVVIALFAVMTRESRLVLKTLWLPGILVFCALALPWYAAVQVRNPQFFREFILQHNLARFSTDLYHHREPFWYYLPVTLLALAPWTIFVIAAFIEPVRAWWAERNAPSEEPDYELQFKLFACCWVVVPLVFLILPIEASRLHSAGNSSRSGAAGGLSAATHGTRLLSSEVASRGTCARSVCDDRSCAADRLRGWAASAARGQADVRCIRNIFCTDHGDCFDPGQPRGISYASLRYVDPSRAGGRCGREMGRTCDRSHSFGTLVGD